MTSLRKYPSLGKDRFNGRDRFIRVNRFIAKLPYAKIRKTRFESIQLSTKNYLILIMIHIRELDLNHDPCLRDRFKPRSIFARPFQSTSRVQTFPDYWCSRLGHPFGLKREGGTIEPINKTRSQVLSLKVLHQYKDNFIKHTLNFGYSKPVLIHQYH